MNKTTKKAATNGNGAPPKATHRTKKSKVEFLPLIPMKELKRKEKENTLTPEEALMLAWQDTYNKRHKRLM